MTRDPARPRYTLADVRATVKRRDAWWTVFLVDQIAMRVTLFIANHTSITPNQLTAMSFTFGVAAALSFWEGTYDWLIVGAVLYHLSFTLDCMDGKIARLKGTGSIFGQWLDWILDRMRVLTCSVALFAAQHRLTGDIAFWYLAVVVIVLDMIRYMDALQVSRLREEMKLKIRQARRELRVAHGLPPVDEEIEDAVTDDEDVIVLGMWDEHDDEPGTKPTHMKADLHDEFKSRYAWYPPIRDWLVRWRVRPHLFSGIEFQMFVFIVAPLAGAIKPIVITSAGILTTFEIFIVYKLWLSTRDFKRSLERIQNTFPARQAALPQNNVTERAGP